ncbi:MICOS complex subunit MIC27 [Anopheles aquasalis]|uniref:MICOS complex subunit MIC27 n=1 Tax=Anopheles aquasalis TaxID=42839 RepID=UPI00215A595A|nr:MICOS complex subunit MIC27 [Anopheles aquasalis]XP_050083969.1 MICOS complex subunit MIC27 [Anopheles aquasalis]XP_050083970.1 MICOS complex subunit MIC27 [Anopheles aquasalis]
MIRNAAPFLLGAAAVVSSDQPQKPKPVENKMLCKPSELPLYRPLNQKIACECHQRKTDGKSTGPVGAIEDGFRVVRLQVQDASKLVTDQKKQIVNLYEDGKKQTKFIHDYLNQEDNTMPRVGAIAIGGLAGLIFGLRGGFFKRLIYTSIGAGGVASVCYPQEAEMYAQHGLVEAKKFATIGYNFVYGVKPGDKQLELPTIPSNLGELKDSVSGLAKSAYDAVFPEKK